MCASPFAAAAAVAAAAAAAADVVVCYDAFTRIAVVFLVATIKRRLEFVHLAKTGLSVSFSA